MILRTIAVTLLIGGLATSSPWASTSQPNGAANLNFNRALLHVANQLDRASAAARRARYRTVNVPDIRLPAGQGGNTLGPAGKPSLDQWLQSELTHIRGEKSAKRQSAELAELAASVRRATVIGSGYSSPRDPRAEAAAIVAQRAYQTGGAGPAPAHRETIIEFVLRKLGEWVADLFSRIFGATASHPYFGQIFAVLFITLLAGLLAYLTYALVSMVARRQRPSNSDIGAPLQERVEPDALHELGMDAASRGEYARAVSLLFQASLASFDRAGKLSYDGSLTAGEYRRAVRRTILSASPYFDDIAHVFVLAAFAERPVSKDDFVRADVAYRSLGPLLAT